MGSYHFQKLGGSSDEITFSNYDRRWIYGKSTFYGLCLYAIFFWPAPAIPRRKVIVDITEAAAEDTRARLGFEEASSDWREVINRPDIDVVDICTPNNLHAEIAIQAAKAESTSCAKMART